MLKFIPGNDNCLISLTGEIKVLDRSVCTPIIRDNMVTIDLYGETRTVLLSWLGKLAHYEVDFPEHLRKHLWRIEFNGMHMEFRRAIELPGGFRVVPKFPSVAVTCDGVVIELKTGLHVAVFVSANGYPSIDLWDPAKDRVRNLAIHRLVALAWVPNPDPDEYTVVNHKDGNKLNNHKKNLEWTTHAKNIQHAYDNGLNGAQRRCRLRDIETGEILEFASISKMLGHIGLPKGAYAQYLLLKKSKRSPIFATKYEVRTADDLTPWLDGTTSIGPLGLPNGKYVTRVTYPDGRTETYYKVSEFWRKLKLDSRYVPGMDKVVETAKKLIPGIKVEQIQEWGNRPVQAYRLSDGKVFDAVSIMKLSEMTGVAKSSVHRALQKGENQVVSGFAFRYQTDQSWSKTFVRYKNSAVCIRAINLTTGEDFEEPSIIAVSKRTGLGKRTILRAILTRKPVKGWVFREVVGLVTE
jgi:hypothetical protein